MDDLEKKYIDITTGRITRLLKFSGNNIRKIKCFDKVLSYDKEYHILCDNYTITFKFECGYIKVNYDSSMNEIFEDADIFIGFEKQNLYKLILKKYNEILYSIGLIFHVFPRDSYSKNSIKSLIGISDPLNVYDTVYIHDYAKNRYVTILVTLPDEVICEITTMGDYIKGYDPHIHNSIKSIESLVAENILELENKQKIESENISMENLKQEIGTVSYHYHSNSKKTVTGEEVYFSLSTATDKDYTKSDSLTLPKVIKLLSNESSEEENEIRYTYELSNGDVLYVDISNNIIGNVIGSYYITGKNILNVKNIFDRLLDMYIRRSLNTLEVSSKHFSANKIIRERKDPYVKGFNKKRVYITNLVYENDMYLYNFKMSDDSNLSYIIEEDDTLEDCEKEQYLYMTKENIESCECLYKGDPIIVDVEYDWTPGEGYNKDYRRIVCTLSNGSERKFHFNKNNYTKIPNKEYIIGNTFGELTAIMRLIMDYELDFKTKFIEDLK